MRKRMLCAVLCILLVFASGFEAYATKNDVKKAQEKKNTLEAEKAKTQSMISELKNLEADVNAYVKKLDGDLETIGREITDLGERIKISEGEIAQKETELTAAQAASDKQYADMKLRIKYMYERSDTTFIDMVLNSHSLMEILNSGEYIAKISEYDRQKLDEYEATHARIAEVKAGIEAEKDSLIGMKEAAEAKEDSLQTLMAEKKEELANYESRIGTAKSELAEVEKQIKAQEDTIKNIEAEIRRREEEARKAAEAAGKAYKTVNLGDIHFAWPCPASGRITSYFGDREQPVKGASTDHKGIDIGASKGSDIKAAAGGEVIISTYSPSAGNYIMINHGGGVFTVYMHASELLAGVGETVKQGQTIAKVGSTGYSSGPHLHFGIRAGGKYLNPLAYVSP